MTQPTRNSELMTSFMLYCLNHPDERFWQALLNWSGMSKIAAIGLFGGPSRDTFYWEGKNS